MLEYLRQRASSWLSKVILGVIALIFALYFGFSGGGAPQGGTAPIAKVNGQNIPSGLFNQNVQSTTQVYQQFGNQTGNPDFQKVIQSQVLQRLISGTLLSQEANKLGLHITDVELAKAIRTNPNFQQDGRFNEEFYLKQFKPYYERQNGQNFEFSLREDLLKARFIQILDQASIVSQNQVKDAQTVQGTQLKLRKLEVPFDTADGGRNKEAAEKIAQDWIQARQDKKAGQEVLKKHNLDVSEVDSKPVAALLAYFGKNTSLPVLLCLLNLEAGQVCEKPFTIGKTIVAVELVERSQKEKSEKPTEQIETQLNQAKRNQVLTGVTNLLTRQAKIETFLQD